MCLTSAPASPTQVLCPGEREVQATVCMARKTLVDIGHLLAKAALTANYCFSSQIILKSYCNNVKPTRNGLFSAFMTVNLTTGRHSVVAPT